jgi:putative endonuclease
MSVLRETRDPAGAGGRAKACGLEVFLSGRVLVRRIKAAVLGRDSGPSPSPTAAPTRQAVGARGEKLAADLLRGRGYEIVEANFRCRQGEIDLIARQGECLVFVEVRTKRGRGFGSPEESITATKRDRLIALADAYVQSLSAIPESWRIDVVAVELAENGGVRRLDHIENAVS